jgi:hypothetical protein
MSSFATHHRRLHDPALPPHHRLSNLRSCIERFAPYGFRSTYFHLTVSAGIPRNLDADPASLVRAADELHEARTIWLAGISPLASQRHDLKRAGRAGGLPDASWWTGFGTVLTRSPDPRRHPDMPLAAFIRRQLDRASGAALTGCPACGDLRAPLSHATGHGFVDRCRRCGGLIRPCQCGAGHWDEAHRFDHLWPGIWQRQHMDDAGRRNLRWPGWTAL